MKEKQKIFEKMVSKYGDILSGQYISNVCQKNENAYEIEIEICKTYIKELDYNKRHSEKYKI